MAHQHAMIYLIQITLILVLFLSRLFPITWQGH